jgi:hypothetical protein
LIVLNPNNPVATIRNLVSIGNVELITPLLDKVNMLADGGELIQAAIS